MGLIDQILRRRARTAGSTRTLVQKRGLTGGVEAARTSSATCSTTRARCCGWRSCSTTRTTRRTRSSRRSTRTSSRCAGAGGHGDAGSRAGEGAERVLRGIEPAFGFGRADLLASFALFDDDPAEVNRIEPSCRGDAGADPEDGAGVSAADQPHRRGPAAGGRQVMRARAVRTRGARHRAGVRGSRDAARPGSHPALRAAATTTALHPRTGCKVTLVPYGAIPKTHVCAGRAGGQRRRGGPPDRTGGPHGQAPPAGHGTTKSAVELAEAAAGSAVRWRPTSVRTTTCAGHRVPR